MGIIQNIKSFLWNTKNSLLDIKYFESQSSKITSNLASPPIVLAYHHFSPNKEKDKYTVSIKQFEKQITHLKKEGYLFLWQSEYGNYNQKSVIISIDDGWMDNFAYIFPIIKKHQIKITINLTVKFTLCEQPVKSYFSLKEIQEMADSGLVSFDSHSMTHPHLSECTDDELEYEIYESQKLMKSVLGIDTDVFVCPYEDANEKVINTIKRYYKMAYNYANNCDPLFSVRRVYSYENTTPKDLSVSSYYHYLYYYRSHSQKL